MPQSHRRDARVGALSPIPGLPRSKEGTIYDDRAASDNWESGHLED